MSSPTRISARTSLRPFLLPLSVLALSLGPLLAPATSSAAVAPHWRIQANSAPTNVNPITGGTLTLLAVNDGGGATSGQPATITDTLPVGLTVVAVEPSLEPFLAGAAEPTCTHTSATVTCVFGGVVPGDSREGLVVLIRVSVEPGIVGALAPANIATVTGGGAPAMSTSDTVVVSAAEAPFSFEGAFQASVLDSAGAIDTQAGSHPNTYTTGFVLSTRASTAAPEVPQNAKDVSVDLPPGLVGDAQTAPTCPEYLVAPPNNGFACPPASVVGSVAFDHRGTWELSGALSGKPTVSPLFNVTPDQGNAAQFAFSFSNQEASLDARLVHSEAGYIVRVTAENILAAAKLVGANITIFGDPASVDESGVASAAFLTNPTDCGGGPLKTQIHVDSWLHPASLPLGPDGGPDFAAPNFSEPQWVGAETESPAVTGCNKLGFNPTIEALPTSKGSGSPSGLDVDLRVPQNTDPEGLATPPLKDVTVALPNGLSISPSSANGLQACSDAQFAADSIQPSTCPDASVVGSVRVHTPLLAEELEGQVFVGTPECDPCSSADAQDGRMVRLFIEIANAKRGIDVKVPGTVSLDPSTGQLTATFKGLPQLPFDNLRFDFKSGERGPLSTPPGCGSYAASVDLTPWSAPYTQDAVLNPGFEITEGCGAHGFAPSFSAGTAGAQAGAYSPLVLSLTRTDQDQDLSSLSATLPPGLLAKLAGVAECGEAEIAAARANTGECPAASQIGTVTVAAGPGADPYYVTGKDYLTGPYNGGPFGEVVVNPAVAGPFNLGNVVVRGSIRVDPTTAQGSFLSDPFPSILDGIPLQLRSIHVALDRPGLTFNATNCQPLTFAATVSSTHGATTTPSNPYQAVNCATLPFKPTLTASTQGSTGRVNGASLDVRIATHQGPDVKPGEREANIRRVDVQLPRFLPSRDSTLKQACTEHQFAVNPAACPAGSFVGTAIAHTPLLSAPLEGPAVLVSHGGAAFPDLDLVLQGEGVKIVLTGNTDIEKGITYSRFETAPDAPFSSFELRLPEGPHSVLGSYIPTSPTDNFCNLRKTTSRQVTRRVHGHTKKVTVKTRTTSTATLLMPTTITAQNGAVTTQTTKIAVTGCPTAAAAKKAAAARKARSAGRRR